ncbi:MAG: VOC family protein [Bdellovibrionota bacterium]|nr:VOC family protein [Bdellovibrionota bacterium]
MHQQIIDFLSRAFTQLEKNKLNLKNWEIDHVCYRTSSIENYEESKAVFEQIGTCLVESPVNGRLIATYKLNEAIRFKEYFIDLVEVPAPKPGKVTKEGFEHFEVVIDQDFESFMQENSQFEYSTKGMAKLLNPELEIEFEDFAIKFHHKSLEHIINIELNDKIMSFLNESKILEALKEYSPCLSGTIPLNIHNDQSDLDILLETENLDSAYQELESIFRTYSNFSIKQYQQNEKTIVLVNFDYKDLPIELFCTTESVYKQAANQHFLVEGKILKLSNTAFKDQIIALKKSGEKTEPAFGKLMDLKEPYSDLIELNKKTEAQIYKAIPN